MQNRTSITRIILTLVLFTCAMTMCFISANAAEPRYVGVSYVSADLEITSGGRATCNGSCGTRPGYSVDVVMELQQESGSTWTTIKTWSGEGSEVILEKNIYVVKGHNYRVMVSADVYNGSGNIVDSLTTYSNLKAY